MNSRVIDVTFRPETPLDWQLRSACRGVSPEIFFPESGQSTTAARRVCAGCPVRTECLAYAVKNRERFGVWGGLSERELRVVLRENPAVRETCVSGRHPRTPENTGSGGRCLACRRECDGSRRAAYGEPPQAAVPRYGKELAA